MFSRIENVEVRFGLAFAIAGFAIATALGAFAFYITSHALFGYDYLFLLLCPPSIGAIALDRAGVVGGIIGRLFISIENAVLYGGVGFLLGHATKS